MWLRVELGTFCIRAMHEQGCGRGQDACMRSSGIRRATHGVRRVAVAHIKQLHIHLRVTCAYSLIGGEQQRWCTCTVSTSGKNMWCGATVAKFSKVCRGKGVDVQRTAKKVNSGKNM